MVLWLILHGIRTGFLKNSILLIDFGEVFFLRIERACAVSGHVFDINVIEEATFWCSCYNLEDKV